MIALYLLGKLCIWVAKVLIVCVAAMLYASAAVVVFLALLLTEIYNRLTKEEAKT